MIASTSGEEKVRVCETVAAETEKEAQDAAAMFVVAVKGSLMYGHRARQALTVVFVRPDEPAFEIQAGPQGLEALVPLQRHLRSATILWTGPIVGSTLWLLRHVDRSL